ncbi:hypothetical protein [Streptomyces sp. SID9124]|nr:hypothetical protein [Streptomyces sp. SID9124]NED12069.1 hypothetical protein [Streptomyces sp. SID9124]NED15791.1 hypothetical protein [Streptomyces sp. SID9124]
MARWIIGYPDSAPPPEATEPDENDYCSDCYGDVSSCVCPDLVAPAPQQL